jgi:hypothetical protein
MKRGAKTQAKILIRRAKLAVSYEQGNLSISQAWAKYDEAVAKLQSALRKRKLRS